MKAINLVLLCLLVFSNSVFAQLEIEMALCENRLNPTGVNWKDLRFSWEMSSEGRDEVQTAYQLVVATSKENLQEERYDIYNSGIIRTEQSIQVEYKGPELEAGRQYFWKVRVWDKNNSVSGWSSLQQFTTGLFSEADWVNAKWIGYEELPDSLRVVPSIHVYNQPLMNSLGDKCKKCPVSPLFRKEFTVNRKVKSALLFISGLGQYEASINGAKAGNSFMTPGWTFYDKTVLYNIYDVTGQLRKGENAIGVILGNGFYFISRERYFKMAQAFGMPKMKCRLKIIYEDGSVGNVISDSDWRTVPSPITYNNIFGGEDYDARLEQSGWNNSHFNDAAWRKALEVEAPLGKLLPEQDYPVELYDEIKVEKVWQPKPGVYMFDFGQNASGIVQLRVAGKSGHTIKLTPAELLNSEQMANQEASGKPHCYNYTLNGNGDEVWQPRFTYYGFRYVQVEGAVPENAVNPLNLPVIKGLRFLHNRNSNPQNGSFTCSDPLFNRIDSLILWAIKSNMQCVITDCPHREKMGWSEVVHLMGNSVNYNYQIYNLYRSTVMGTIDAQRADGGLPEMIPGYLVDAEFLIPEWESASVIIPWQLYKWYGDMNTMREAYDMMKKYVEYLQGQPGGPIISSVLGDWVDLGPKPPGPAQLTPNSLTATAIYYYDVQLMGKMAALLGKKDDASQYEKLAALIKTAFNKQFFNETTRVYSTGSQTAMSMPLCVGLVDEQYKKQVVKNLVDSIYANNKALTAGDIGFHFLVQALDEGGASQLIYDMNHRDDIPGYGFQLKKGATTLTESWQGLEEVSNNHMMLGHIMEWFYSGLAGISQEENSIAFKHIKIRPQPVGHITSAKGSFHSPYGLITTDWEKGTGNFVLKSHIPVNTIATVYLPVNDLANIYKNGNRIKDLKIMDNTAMVEVGSGDYVFEVRYE